MSDMDQAVSVTTSVDIDWGELGRVFADQVSPDQAAFLIGFYEAVVDMQLAYIGAEKLFDAAGERQHIARLFESLAYFIGGDR